MLVIWKLSLFLVVPFFVVYASIELIYLSSEIEKFIQGGYLPLLFAGVLMTMMWIWHYVYKERYISELENRVSDDYIRDLATNPSINRAPGIGLLFSELVQGITPIFPHYVSNIPTIPSVLVFVSIKHIPVCIVAKEERFLFRQVEPRDYRMFRCVARYGYKDVFDQPEFEQELIQNLKEFVRQQNFMLDGKPMVQCNDEYLAEQNNPQSYMHPQSADSSRFASFRIVSEPILGEEEEIQFIERVREEGIVYLLGEPEVMAKPNSSIFRKFTVNYAYPFLKNNFRQAKEMMSIPPSKVLKVGMTYEI